MTNWPTANFSVGQVVEYAGQIVQVFRYADLDALIAGARADLAAGRVREAASV